MESHIFSFLVFAFFPKWKEYKIVDAVSFAIICLFALKHL